MQNAKSRMFNNKKAINDISIIAILVFILVGTAVIIPFINSAMDTSSDTFDTDTFASGIKDESQTVEPKLTDISLVRVFINMFKLATFDIGNTLELPFWLDIVYTILAILLILVVSRNIWIGGGG